MYKCAAFLSLTVCLIFKEENNISETESIIFSGWKVVQWLRIALYMRSSSVCASISHTWGWEYTVYAMLCYIQNTRQWTESGNLSPIPVFCSLETFQPKLCTNFLSPLVKIFHSSFVCSSLLQEYEVKSKYCKVPYYATVFILVLLLSPNTFFTTLLSNVPNLRSSHLVRDHCLQLYTSDKTRKVDKLSCALCHVKGVKA